MQSRRNPFSGGTKAVVYRLKLNLPAAECSLWLLKGDENVLYFLSREKRLLPGHADFSHTLNRVVTVSE